MLNVVNYQLSKDNQKEIDALKHKVIVFVVPESPLVGAQKNEVRFPYKGKIIDVFASCSTTGTTDTEITVETISLDQLENFSDTWVEAVNSITIPSEKRTNISVPINIINESINANDYVRVVIQSLGQDLRNMTVEVIVELDI